MDRHARNAAVDALAKDYKRLVYLELCLSVVLGEHNNGAGEDYLIRELTDCLKGGPYERKPE